MKQGTIFQYLEEKGVKDKFIHCGATSGPEEQSGENRGGIDEEYTDYQDIADDDGYYADEDDGDDAFEDYLNSMATEEVEGEDGYWEDDWIDDFEDEMEDE